MCNNLKFLVFIFLFQISGIKAQVFEIQHTADLQNQPTWIQMMYQEDADPESVAQAYEDYYQTHEFVKNIHTQYYKRWQRAINRDINGWFTSKGTMSPLYIRAAAAEYMERTEALKLQRGPASAWECVGPFDFDKESVSRSYASGAAHVYTVEQSISNPNILYAGTATAGVYKSIDKGLNWTSVTKDMLVNGLRSIEIDYTNPDVVYFESGGVLYKTTNGGTTWSPIGDATFQASSHSIKDIVMHPTNNQIIFLCAEDGLYRTTDAGSNWTQVESGYFQEIEFKPNDVSTVYAVKQPGSQTEFYKSTDSGISWTLKPTGWPSVSGTDEQKRTEIAVSAAAPNNVYALATGKVNGGSGLFGIYKSTDSGETWSFTCCGPQPGGVPSTSNPNLMGWSDQGTDDGGQFYYDLSFAVDPNNADKVHVGGVNHWVSTDGGATFSCPSKWSHVDKVNYVHADIHDIHYYGNDLWFACDGGIFYSNDGGATINRRQLGIAGSDFWGFGIGFSDPEVMIGGTYHNGTLLKDNNVYTNGWLCTGGGDNIRGFVNPGDPRIVYFDYGEQRLSGDRQQSFQSLTLNLDPNGSYTPGRSSNIEFFPDNSSSFYLGNDTKIWKTTDDGITFTEIYDFGSKVGEIRIAWSNPDYIYCTTFDPTRKVWASQDGGSSWTDITPGGTSRYYDIAVSNSDANMVWAARLETTSSNRVYFSTNGGSSWTNITGAGMPNEKISNIVCQQGTNGGLYVGTRRAVYYKNQSMGDWALFNNNLPASTYSTRLVPNYRSGKLYNGSNRSVYKVDFYEASSPIAQLSADKTSLFCTGEQVQFSSHSVASGNASYSWSFPGGTPSSSSIANPVVMYNTPGSYGVTLSVSDTGGSDSQSKTNFITVGNQCEPETIPGMALSCQDGSSDYVQIDPLNLSTNTITFTAWIKRNGDQNYYAGLIFSRGGSTTAGLNFKTNNHLGYHWDSGNYSWDSGHIPPDGEWTHVALVIEPTKATIYMNGVPSTHNATHHEKPFDANLLIGGDPNSGRKFKGLMDEVCIFDKALSQTEVRELMHLTKPTGTPNLIHYYQFNEASGVATDRAGGLSHATFHGGASRTTSTAPFGGGFSQTQNVTSGGVYEYNKTGVTLTFPNSGSYPDGDLVVSRINQQPDQTAGNNPTPNDAYWVINNYGSSNAFSELTSMKFEGISPIVTTNNGSEYKLHKRSSTADGNTWGAELDYADAATTSTLTFAAGNSVTSFSQFSINKANPVVLPVTLLNFSVTPRNNTALIEWQTAAEINHQLFVLERSKDAIHFSAITEVPAKGTSNAGAAYSFIDRFPYKGVTYYRLKQVDQNGEFTYSKIKQITINSKASEVVVYPNPIGRNKLLNVESDFLTDYRLLLFNPSGKLIKEVSLKSGNGKVDISSLPAGVYFYQFRDEHYIKNGSLIIE